MSKPMTVSEARAALPEILDRVRAGDEVVLTRHGEPVAVVVRPDTLRARRAHAVMAEGDHVRDLLAKARATKLRRRPTLTVAQADALAADVRAARARR